VVELLHFPAKSFCQEMEKSGEGRKAGNDRALERTGASVLSMHVCTSLTSFNEWTTVLDYRHLVDPSLCSKVLRMPACALG
jgi:hypothetical protein